MDFAFVIRRRLEELHLDQRDLANACEVTESYISQILGRRKLPPVPNRTDLYDKMSVLLGVSREELARLAALQHHDRLDRSWLPATEARFGPMRELILAKCRAHQTAMREIFETDAFGPLERVITRTVVETIRDEARLRARDETWLRSLAAGAGLSYRTMRVKLIDLLENDGAGTLGDFTPFLDPIVEWWTFDIDRFTLSVRLTNGATRKFEFAEQQRREKPAADPAGLRAFLRDSRLSGGITPEESAILRSVRLPEPQRATALFYYRLLQNLRDPVHFK
jgi:transcriptional regulator with XRE-family HTH domain